MFLAQRLAALEEGWNELQKMWDNTQVSTAPFLSNNSSSHGQKGMPPCPRLSMFRLNECLFRE